MNYIELIETLEGIPAARALVLGDLILDRYTWGNADRISPEAPVLVLHADRRESRLGGAANAANMFVGLGGKATCAGVVGNDSDGHCLTDLMQEIGIDTQLVLTDPARPTTSKERFIGRASTRHPSQILRVDHETREPLPEHIQDELIERIVSHISEFDVVLVSDYGKGVCTPRVLAATISAARNANIPVLIDPIRAVDLSRYRGATLLKANRYETESATGRRIQDPREALPAGQVLCEQLDLKAAVVTLDRDGMVAVRRDGTGGVFPTAARGVYDITGAGDLVFAVLGLCTAANVKLETAARIANVAAGLKVAKFGVAVVSREEIRTELLSGHTPGLRKILTLEQAAQRAAEHRRRGQTVVMTNGCFDLLHVGHVTNLAEASRMGDVLLVGINSDSSVKRLKGSRRPVIGEADRAAMLAALDCVDYVVVFDDDTPHAMLHAVQPDVLVKGGTYAPHEVVGHEVVESYGGKVRVTGVVEGISTTAILKSLYHDDKPAIAGSITAVSLMSSLPEASPEAGKGFDEAQTEQMGRHRAAG
jgi:D-beta-D-heptose 7-phosphate kinase/D-beta-D-heptose 1-phosphate adenosyltransferase